MKLKHSICAMMLFTPVAATASNYYEACNDVLVDGVLQTYEATNSYEAKIALKKWLCSHESSSSGGGGGLQLDVIGIFNFGGNGGGAKEWKKEHCHGSDYNYEGSKASHVLIQHANTSVVNAWSQCIKDIRPEQLACYAEQTNDSLLMKVDLQHGVGNVKNVDVTATNMTALTNIPNKFRPGQTHMRFQLNNTNQEAYFDMNGNTKYRNVACSYTIPLKPVSEDGDLGCEDLRNQAYENGKITLFDYYYLRDHNEIPLFSSKDGSYIGRYSCDLF